MNIYRSRCLLLLLLLTTAFSACKKQWDDRTAIADQQLDKTLMQKIQENSNLSIFSGYLTKIGYDKILSSTKTYTVWAPDNQALQGMDASIVADTAKLRLFVSNHIANQAYLTANASPSLRVRTFTGKKVTFTTTTVEDATITTANQYVNNGVLHIINKTLAPKMNIYEYIKSLTTVGALHKAYLQRQDSTFVDSSKATVASVDPATGKNILVPGTGIVTRNKYFVNVANLASEDSLYTYFVLTDDAYNAERNKVSRFFTTSSVDTTMNMLAAINVLKDVAVKGVYPQATLPETLISVKGVQVPVNKGAILQTYNASNGVVYVMSSMNFKLEEKIPPIVVQGETPTAVLGNANRNNIQFRTKRDNNGVLYSDIQFSGANLPASYYARYKLSNLYTCQYKVTWRAINDFAYATATNLSQRLGFSQLGYIFVPATGTAYSAQVQFPYTTVTPQNYAEVQLASATTNASIIPIANPTINATAGTLNITKYASVNMYLQGPTTTALNTNVFTLDYVKLTPIY